MRIEAAVASDTGRIRKHNEDSFGSDEALGLYIVCDGMGGHAAGEVASKTAVNAIIGALHVERSVIESYDGSPDALSRCSSLLRRAVSEASRKVYELAASDRGKHGMGTTAVVLLMLGEKALVAHVGDSRLYVARDGRIMQLTADHNFLNELIARGVMNAQQAAAAPHSNVLTRAVGVQPTVAVDLLAFDVLPGDTLLLCSDGLYDYALEGNVLAEELSEPELAAIPKNLVRRALDGGGHDNATALVVRALSDSPHHHERRTSVRKQLDALAELDLFRALALPELVKLYNLFTTLLVSAGQLVIREGDEGEHLFVVVDGKFQIARGGLQIAELGAGAHFGEMALLNRRPRTATVTALEPARLLQLSRVAFHELLNTEPALATKILMRLAETLSLRLDDTYLARDFRAGRKTLGLGEYP
jgi:PPM family protein phosphatase